MSDDDRAAPSHPCDRSTCTSCTAYAAGAGMHRSGDVEGVPTTLVPVFALSHHYLWCSQFDDPCQNRGYFGAAPSGEYFFVP